MLPRRGSGGTWPGCQPPAPAGLTPHGRVPAHLRGRARWGHRCGHPAGGNACGKVAEEQGLQQHDLHPSPWPRGRLAAPALCPSTSPTSWCWARSGCRRCHPRRSMGPGPGSTQRRLCRRHHSGAGAAGPAPRPSRHRAVAGGGAESRAEHLGASARGRAKPRQDTGTHLGSPLTRLEESCRLVMGEASCGQSAGRS